MPPEEGRKILELRARHTPDEVDAAYAAKYRAWLLRSQHATKPEDRESAHRALVFLRMAYQSVTGKPPPDRLPAATNGSAATARRPAATGKRRGRAGSTPAPQSANPASGTGASHPAVSARSSPRSFWPLSMETLTSAFICAVMGIIALFILAKAGAGGP